MILNYRNNTNTLIKHSSVEIIVFESFLVLSFCYYKAKSSTGKFLFHSAWRFWKLFPNLIGLSVRKYFFFNLRIS